VSWLLVLITGSTAVKPGSDFEERWMMIIGPLLDGLFANVAYTAGPIFDEIFYREKPRRQLFKAVYTFAVVVTGLPGVWALVAWLSTVITEAKIHLDNG
jgi:hypothetical protein